MKLIEMTLEDFTKLTASDAAAPGGGSISALAGSLGTALIHMVSALTVGRKRYAEHDAFNEELLTKCDALGDALTKLIDEDTEAFAEYMRAMKLPKESEAEKAARKQAMQEALRACIRVPLSVLTHCVEALRLAQSALGRINPNAISDLGVSALCLKAGLQGASLNVRINLSGLADRDYALEQENKTRALLGEGEALADSLYAHVLEQIAG